MRRAPSSLPPAAAGVRRRSDWSTLKMLLPYLWAHRGRVVLALACLLAAKAANVGVPVVLKDLVDRLTTGAPQLVPVGLVLAYGALRVSTSVFTELRELVFARVTQGAMRRIALQVFDHLHALSLRFHLDRQTGGLTRDIERGSRAVSSLVSFTLYSILPTIVEIALVTGYLVSHYAIDFTLITFAAFAVYVAFTIVVTEWRTGMRRAMNELDSRANVRAIDSLINYETVKYFGNERFESQRYDASMADWERAAVRSQQGLSMLNVGQALIISLAVTAMVWRAAAGVADGTMSIGDLVLVNAFMIQLYAPLNFLGVLYREIKQSLADLERLFGLLGEHREVDDAPGALPLRVDGACIRFDDVHFGYTPQREILHGVSFTIGAGRTVAIVGASGAGKSTLSRLLFRFYDPSSGRILIDGQDTRTVTQASLRAAIGIVPQDTVLFNDTIRYNIRYGRPGASDAEVEAAAHAARLDGLIARLPDGWDTPVGERGLKLSGGEKQRVAIARMLLKNPPVLVLDEATSALDSASEQAIQQALASVAHGRTVMVIAHRLSTIVDADRIVVLDDGRVVESGRHAELLAAGGAYARLWAAQARQHDRRSADEVPG